MRRPISTLIALVGMLSLAPVQARSQSISVGVLAGASLSTFTGDIVSDAKNYAGFIAGGFVRLGAMGFSVQPGVYYTTKGVKSEDFTGESSGRTKLSYVQVPLVIRLGMGSGKMHLYACEEKDLRMVM